MAYEMSYDRRMTGWTSDPDELLTLQDAAALIPGADADTLKGFIRSGNLKGLSPWQRTFDHAC
jgi:hypothetical protein